MGLAAAAGDGCGCSSGVEHNLAKVGVEGSNPFARSKFPQGNQDATRRPPQGGLRRFCYGVHMVSTTASMDTRPAMTAREVAKISALPHEWHVVATIGRQRALTLGATSSSRMPR